MSKSEHLHKNINFLKELKNFDKKSRESSC